MRISLTKATIYSACVFGSVFSALALSGIPGWSRLALVFSGLIAVLTIIDIAVHKIALGKWIVLPVGFVALAVISGVVSYPASHDELVRLLAAWGSALLIGDAVRRGVPVNIVISAMLCASIANAAAVLVGFDAYYTYSATAEQQAFASILDRRTGLVGNANLLAVQAFLPLFAVLIWGRSTSAVLVALGIACAAYAIYSTGSRKSVVLLLFLLSAAWLRLPMAKRWIVVGVTFLLALAISLLMIGDGTLGNVENAAREVLAIERIYQAFEGRDSSFLERQALIDAAQAMFLENPMLGSGLGSFVELSGFGLYTHNNFWEITVAGGLLLLVSFYAIHLSVFVRVLRSALQGHEGSAAACALIAAILLNDVGMVSYDQDVVVLVLVLLLVWVRSPNATGMQNSSLLSRHQRVGGGQ